MKELVDPGCEISVVHKDLVPELKLTGTCTIYLQGILDEAVKSLLIKFPLALAIP